MIEAASLFVLDTLLSTYDYYSYPKQFTVCVIMILVLFVGVVPMVLVVVMSSSSNTYQQEKCKIATMTLNTDQSVVGHFFV